VLKTIRKKKIKITKIILIIFSKVFYINKIIKNQI